MYREPRRPRLDRRELIALGGSFAIAYPVFGVRAARADRTAMRARMAEIVGGRAVGEGRVRLNLPHVAENGATVPLAVEVESPMRADDYVEAVHILSERNPEAQVASFYFTPRSGEARVETRIRLAESQTVHALAEMSDGSVFAVASEVEVVIGGCGG